AAAFASDEKEEAKSLIQALRAEYEELLEQLFATPEGLENGRNLIDYQFDLIQSFSNQIFTQADEKILLAQGELISTTLFHFYLTEIGKKSVLLAALDFMKIDEDNEPDI